MTIGNVVLAAILIVLVVGSVYGLVLGFWAAMRYRGKRLITCPETHQAAAVHVNTSKASIGAILGQKQVRLDQCSRWPERQNCGQDCLSQINADPEHCLVWNIVGVRNASARHCRVNFHVFKVLFQGQADTLGNASI